MAAVEVSGLAAGETLSDWSLPRPEMHSQYGLIL